jgi:pimeloyl-ACP methyl ester carboxylesterase
MYSTKTQTAEKTVNVQNVQIFVRERGAGEPVLFLHGVPDSADMWDTIIEHLEGDYHVIAPDLPGLARSTITDDFDLSLENKARFVNDLLDALNITKPVHLVGHDFGGHYGLAWAVRHPQRVLTITVSNTSFFTDYHWHSSAQIWRTPVLGELVMAILSPNLYANTMKKNAPNLTSEQISHQYAQSWNVPSVRRTILRMYRATDPQRDFIGWQDELRALAGRVPVQVLWGDADPFAAPMYAEKFGTKNVQHFADYGHWLPIEAPKLYAEKLSAFFKR